MIFLGTGVILTGLVIFYLWFNNEVDGRLQVTDGSKVVPVEVDYESPKITLSDVDGEEHSLADYQGQIVLVNLWATWCPPCKAEMPTLKTYYEAYKDYGFVTIAINDGDPTDSVVGFVDEYKLTFPVWLDSTYEATERAFKTLSLPSSFVIDREGQVRLRWLGEIDRAALEKYVTPLIME